MSDLRVDPARSKKDKGPCNGCGHNPYETGIYVRAFDPTERLWVTVDLAYLDANSVREWLRSRGGDNEWAENTVLILLGHPTANFPEAPIIARERQ